MTRSSSGPFHPVRRGSPDPAVCRTAGLPPGPGLETCRPSGKVRRPCHNLGPGGAGGGERAIKTAKSLGRKGSQGGKGSGAGFVMDRRSRLLTLFHLTNRSKAAALLTAVRARRFV